MKRIVIEIENGLVQAVWSRSKDIMVEIVDWDDQRDDATEENERIMKSIHKAKSYKNIW